MPGMKQLLAIAVLSLPAVVPALPAEGACSRTEVSRVKIVPQPNKVAIRVWKRSYLLDQQIL